MLACIWLATELKCCYVCCPELAQEGEISPKLELLNLKRTSEESLQVYKLLGSPSSAKLPSSSFSAPWSCPHWDTGQVQNVVLMPARERHYPRRNLVHKHKWGITGYVIALQIVKDELGGLLKPFLLCDVGGLVIWGFLFCKTVSSRARPIHISFKSTPMV